MSRKTPIIQSYLPLERNERSKLQHIKDKHRSFTQTSKEGIPKDLNELKLMRKREHAISFIDLYIDIDKSTSKSKYCKDKHISHNSLNTGLKSLGYEKHVKRDRTRPIETNLDQTRPIDTDVDQTRPKKKKVKPKDTEPNTASVSAGFSDTRANASRIPSGSDTHANVSRSHSGILTEEDIRKGIQ